MSNNDPQDLPTVNIISKPDIPTLEQFMALIKSKNLARTERFFVQIGIPAGMIGLDSAVRNKITAMILLCEEAAIPGKTINTRTLRINGLNEQRAETADYMGEITLQFLIDTDWAPREIIETWMTHCVNHPDLGREVGFYENYIANVTLHALVPAGIPGEKILNWSPTQADIGLKRQLPAYLREGKPGVVLNKVLNYGKRKIDEKITKAKTQLFGAIAPLANPLIEALRETESIAYSISLKECWPKSINVMPMSWSNPGVHRMNVTFVYKYWVSDFSDNPEDFEDKVVNKFNSFVSEKMKKLTDKIPGVTNKLSSLGNNLKAKALQKFGKRFGG